MHAADMVIYNAKIITVNTKAPEAKAVAIKNGHFFALAHDNNHIKQWCNQHTIMIDARQKTIIPGLIDSHLHVIREGLNYDMEVRWDGIKSLKEALHILHVQAKKVVSGQWVRVVGGWSEFQFAEKRMPTHAEINEVSKDVPVFVMHLYERVLLNKAAIEFVGYNKNIPQIPGSFFEKDAQGNFTGAIIAYPAATALYATLAKGPKLSPVEQYNSTVHYLKELNRLGITSVIDAGGGYQQFPENYAVISDLAQQKKLTVRIAYNLFTQRPGHELEDFKMWIANYKMGQGDDYYRLNGAGEMLVYSAADYENFMQPRPELSANMEEELFPVVKHLVENRWSFRLHATYNESISRFLNVFEKVDKKIPFNGLRWFFDHCETINVKNLERVKALGGGIAIQDRMAYQGEIFIDRYGAQVAAYTPPIRTMLDMEIPLGAGTDGTRVASYNPWISLYWLVSGKTIGGTEIYKKDNRVDRLTALTLYTLGSAWFSHDEDKKGKIESGYLADLAILSDDYFTTDEENIKNITSMFTLVGGKIVHATDEFDSYII